jgi:hypothetical protein
VERDTQIYRALPVVETLTGIVALKESVTLPRLQSEIDRKNVISIKSRDDC